MANTVLGLAGVVLFPDPAAVFLFLCLSAVTLCAGHSVGMHRLLIHRSFGTQKWLEYLLVWLGTLVGMAGPFGMIRAHDLRDWHQRQVYCPPHRSHDTGFWRDAWWQLHCEYQMSAPPRFQLEPDIANDPVYLWMERLWMLQVLPLGALLYLLGGWAFVLWGISFRVSVSLIGHWMVGHFAHRRSQQGWKIKGLPVQGYNLPGLGLLTFGENWHGNHHAFPHSAKLGLEAGQLDPGFWLIKAFAAMGLVTDINLPSSRPPRDGLMRIEPKEAS